MDSEGDGWESVMEMVSSGDIVEKGIDVWSNCWVGMESCSKIVKTSFEGSIVFKCFSVSSLDVDPQVMGMFVFVKESAVGPFFC